MRKQTPGLCDIEDPDTGLVEIENPATKKMLRVSTKQWDEFLTAIIDGLPPHQATTKFLNLNNSQLRALFAKSPEKKAQYDEARLAKLRRYFGEEEIENICTAVAAGAKVKDALLQNRAEWDDRAPNTIMQNFYSLVLRDPEVRDMYDEARQIQAEKMAIDDVLEIADDTKDDETFDGKPNSAAVNRARLKVDARKWIAAKLHYKRFGDKVQQDVNANVVVDHAARLEEARKRAEKANVLRKQLSKQEK